MVELRDVINKIVELFNKVMKIANKPLFSGNEVEVKTPWFRFKYYIKEGKVEGEVWSEDIDNLYSLCTLIDRVVRCIFERCNNIVKELNITHIKAESPFDDMYIYFENYYGVFKRKDTTITFTAYERSLSVTVEERDIITIRIYVYDSFGTLMLTVETYYNINDVLKKIGVVEECETFVSDINKLLRCIKECVKHSKDIYKEYVKQGIVCRVTIRRWHEVSVYDDVVEGPYFTYNGKSDYLYVLPSSGICDSIDYVKDLRDAVPKLSRIRNIIDVLVKTSPTIKIIETIKLGNIKLSLKPGTVEISVEGLGTLSVKGGDKCSINLVDVSDIEKFISALETYVTETKTFRDVIKKLSLTLLYP
ncbi:MAG: hypothetical protein DRO13_06685 [Thermoprotei archaeon]|nr:MAG: hypothetical protein DRO13_06685 [Thermoprotei archaeon]